MNWKKSLFKPKWRSKDPEVRRQAVAVERDPDLLDAMESIARSDEEPAVRGAAARRLADPSLLFDLLKSEQDASARDAITGRLRSLVCGSAEVEAGIAERERVLRDTRDRELLEAAAEHAPEASLRTIAIGRIERQGFLGDRAIQDPDAAVRRAAAAAIRQHSTLNRVIEACRTSDKALHQELTQRLHAEKLDSGDPEAARVEAQTICEALERIALSNDRDGDGSALEDLLRRWQGVSDRVPEPLARRFEHDLDRIRADRPEVPAAREPAPKPSPEAGGDEPAVAMSPALISARDRIQAAREAKRVPGPKQIKALEAAWERAWSTIDAPSATERELRADALQALNDLRAAAGEQRVLRDQWIEEAGQVSQAMQAALDDGELHKALEQRARLQQLGEKLGGGRRWKSLQGQLNSTMGRLRELRDWQHWANDKIRKRLIEEMEALPAAGLHPDAVLDRIKSLQTEWKRLERSEQIPGDQHYAAAPWMWRRFQAAGKKAFEGTKPFLDKRSEVQAQKVESLRDIATRLMELAATEGADPVQLRRVMGEARKGLGQLSTVPHKARKSLAGKLKKALARANDVMKAHYDEIERQKLRLIREAAQLQHVGDRDEAIAEAKRLQAAWKAAGSLWRKKENALWEQFREPIDPLFENLEAERSADRERHQEQLAAQKALCAQLETIVRLPGDQLAEQQGPVQGLIDGWEAFRHPDRRIRARFDELLAQFRERDKAQRQADDQARWERRRAMAGLVHRAEAAAAEATPEASVRETLESEWPAVDNEPDELETALRQRFDQALAGRVTEPSGDAESRHTQARKICILLEFLAGLPTPEEEQELRMKYQVERLSASLSGSREKVSAVEEARRLEREWLELGFISDSDYERFSQRIEKALKQISEHT